MIVTMTQPERNRYVSDLFVRLSILHDLCFNGYVSTINNSKQFDIELQELFKDDFIEIDNGRVNITTDGRYYLHENLIDIT